MIRSQMEGGSLTKTREKLRGGTPIVLNFGKAEVDGPEGMLT